MLVFEMETTCIQRSKYATNVFRISKYFGIFPYRLKNGLFCISLPYCIVSFFITTCLLYITFLNNILPLFNKPLTKLKVVSHFYFISLVLLYLATLYTSYSRVCSINKIIREIDDVDLILLSADFYKRERLQPKMKIKDVLCAVMCLLIMLYTFLFSSSFLIIFWSYFSIVSTSAVLTGCQFSVMGNIITCRLKESCAILSDLRIPNGVTRRLERIASLSTVHNKLCDLSSALAKSFSIVLTVHISACFIGFTLGSFFAISVQAIIMKYLGKSWFQNVTFGVAFTIVRLISIILSLLSPWQVINSSSDMCKMINNFDTLLYDLMINDKTNEISTNEKLRLHILMKREVRFTASGLFNLDYTLLHSMMYAATTYLVILLQFEQPRAILVED